MKSLIQTLQAPANISAMDLENNIDLDLHVDHFLTNKKIANIEFEKTVNEQSIIKQSMLISSLRLSPRSSLSPSLSLLIEKTNRFHKREKIKQSGSLCILCLLITILIGLYFYVDIKTRQSKIYISQQTTYQLQVK